jgi:hypothetical protein
MGRVTELSQCTDLKEALDVNNAYNSCLTNLSNANIELNKIPTILKKPYALPSFIINLDKVKFNSKILHKSGNLWKYSNGNNFNPCPSGWSVDYSRLKCSKSTTSTSRKSISNLRRNNTATFYTQGPLKNMRYRQYQSGGEWNSGVWFTYYDKNNNNIGSSCHRVNGNCGSHNRGNSWQNLDNRGQSNTYKVVVKVWMERDGRVEMYADNTTSSTETKNFNQI